MQPVFNKGAKIIIIRLISRIVVDYTDDEIDDVSVG
jgi:hypothetical protein